MISSILRYVRLKRAEADAELSGTDIYRLLRTSVDIPYAVVNGDGMVRVLNTAMQNILSYHAPVCNLPLSEVCPGVDPEAIATAARQSDYAASDAPLTGIPMAKTPDRQDLTSPEDAATTVRLANGRRYAISSYLMAMGGEMDEQYAQPDGRKVVYSSLNPVDLLKNANKFTYILLAVILVLVLLVTVITRAIVRKIRRKKK